MPLANSVGELQVRINGKTMSVPDLPLMARGTDRSSAKTFSEPSVTVGLMSAYQTVLAGILLAVQRYGLCPTTGTIAEPLLFGDIFIRPALELQLIPNTLRVHSLPLRECGVK